MREADLQAAVFQLCLMRHLLCYHTHNSERSEPGFLDLCIVGADRMIFRELKTETGKVSEPQQFWIDRLVDVGIDAAVWRPSQLSTDVKTTIMGMQPLKQWPPPKNPPRTRARPVVHKWSV